MELYTVETINFTFQIFAKNKKDFKHYFSMAWAEHCSQYEIPFSVKDFNEICEGYCVVDVELNTVYRDGEQIL